MSSQTLEALETRQAVARVNLLPAEIGQARAFRKLQAGLGLGVLVAAGVAGAAILVTQGHVNDAENALNAELGKTPALQAAQNAYAEVPLVLAQVQAAEAARDEAEAYDVPLYTLMDRVAAGAPADLSLTSLSFTITAGGSGTAAADATSTETVSNAIGSVDVVGVTKTESQVASFMESVDSVDGVGGTALANAARDEEGVITFTLSSNLTTDALAHGS